MAVLAALLFSVACFAQSATASDPGNFPDLGKVWAAEDYQAIYDYISSPGATLPIYEDTQGGRVLARMFALENLNGLGDTGIAIGPRIQNLMLYMDSLNSILKFYLMQTKAGSTYLHREVANCMVMMLHMAAAGGKLIDDFVPTIAHDEKYSTRMDGLAQVYSGYQQMFSGVTISLVAKNYYDASDISAMIVGLKDTIGALKANFTKSFAKDMKSRLTKEMEKSQNPQDKENLKLIVRSLGG